MGYTVMKRARVLALNARSAYQINTDHTLATLQTKLLVVSGQKLYQEMDFEFHNLKMQNTSKKIMLTL
jgi:hypothetical protein